MSELVKCARFNCNNMFKPRGTKRVKKYCSRKCTKNDAQRRHYQKTIEKQREWHREDHKKNKTARNAKSRKYYGKNKGELIEYQKKYRTENEDYLLEYRDKRKPIKKAYGKKRMQDHPELALEYVNRRRAIKMQARPPWVTNEMEKAFAATRPSPRHHWGHIIPLKAMGYIDGKRVQVASGLHVPANWAWQTAEDNLNIGCSLDRALKWLKKQERVEIPSRKISAKKRKKI